MSKDYSYLYCPSGYDKLTKNDKKRICNGCGPKSKFDFVPDTIYGLNISEACNRHDYMYEVSLPNIEDKKEADRSFLNNIIRIIDHETRKRIGWDGLSFKNPLLWLRKRRAYKYYIAVKKFGGPAFWNSKNEKV